MAFSKFQHDIQEKVCGLVHDDGQHVVSRVTCHEQEPQPKHQQRPLCLRGLMACMIDCFVLILSPVQDAVAHTAAAFRCQNTSLLASLGCVVTRDVTTHNEATRMTSPRETMAAKLLASRAGWISKMLPRLGSNQGRICAEWGQTLPSGFPWQRKRTS